MTRPRISRNARRFSGASALHLETSYNARELAAALRGARRGEPGLPLIASLTLDLGNSGLETPLGTPLALLLQAMEREAPDAVTRGPLASERPKGALAPAVERGASNT